MLIQDKVGEEEGVTSLEAGSSVAAELYVD